MDEIEILDGQIRDVPMAGDVLVEYQEHDENGLGETDDDGPVFRMCWMKPELAVRLNLNVLRTLDGE